MAEKLRASAFYTGSTSIAPFLAHAFINGQNIYQQQREKLQENIQTFKQLVAGKTSIQSHNELPIFILPNQYDEAYFEAHKIIISSFPYPDPAGEIINRIVLSALHEKEDLKILLEGF